MNLNWVWIVFRMKDGALLHEFVFKNQEDAQKCVNRLRERFPEENISLDKYIVREGYK